MSRLSDWLDTVTPEEYPPPAPAELDADNQAERRPFKHAPVSHAEFRAAIERAQEDMK